MKWVDDNTLLVDDSGDTIAVIYDNNRELTPSILFKAEQELCGDIINNSYYTWDDFEQ